MQRRNRRTLRDPDGAAWIQIGRSQTHDSFKLARVGFHSEQRWVTGFELFSRWSCG